MEKIKKSKIPFWIQYKKGKNEKSPVWFLDCRGTNFSPKASSWHRKINEKIEMILQEIHAPEWKEPVLIKCHIGEEKCQTRMIPQFCMSTVNHFRRMGMDKIVSGDSTVAYTGKRGFKENHSACTPYLQLAERHRWTEKGPLRIPFIVLDRPDTSVRDIFSFTDEELLQISEDSKYFREVYLSGGFDAAGTIINHIHLTLHDMAQIACTVKGITMGGSSYKGKLIMHKCYFPVIKENACLGCGTCSLKCPEKAMDWTKGEVPRLNRDKCIGCGECMAVCPSRNIAMRTQDIEDWMKGVDSLPYRMVDYMMGMMGGRWERLLNIVHMYNITRRCDCVDEKQKTIIPPIGFLIGRNPFAVDLMATYLLHEEIYNQVQSGKMKTKIDDIPEKDILRVFFPNYHGLAPYSYLQNKYGIVVEPKPVYIKMH